MKQFGRLAFLLILAFAFTVQADENFVTVYSSGLGLVKQVRDVEIDKNVPTLEFKDVAARIIPTSVHLRSLDDDSTIQVVEQNFEYDLVSSQKILEKYIDHNVEIIRENGELIKGILLSKAGNALVLNSDKRIKIIPWNNNMSIIVQDLPRGLITKPTLIWELTGVDEGKETLEVSYLTEQIDWHAEYVGVLNDAGTKMNIASWVSVNNRCGAAFTDARLKLVAGDVNRAPTVNVSPKRTKAAVQMELTATDSGFEERSFFEYHMYELERKTTLKDNQVKQIALFTPSDVNCQKKFFYNASRDAKKINVRLVFKNERESGLGKPLPAGIFRIYQKDHESMEFIGEDRIDHTSVKEDVKITMGNAFDLVGARKIVDQKKISKRSQRQVIEIELRNNKPNDDVEIIVEESLYCSDWDLEDSNFAFTKKDVHNIEFKIPVKAMGKAKLRYTVLCSW